MGKTNTAEVRRVERIAFIMLISLYFLFLPQTACRWDEWGWAHVLYILSHANVFHLACNGIVVLLMRGRLRLLPSFIVAIVCSFIPPLTTHVPVMGCSGMLFAIIGAQWGAARQFKRMTKKVIVPMLLLSLLPNVAWELHVYCLCVGWIYGRLEYCFVWWMKRR